MSEKRLTIRDGDVDTTVIADFEATRRDAVRRGLILGGGVIAASSVPLLLRVRNAFAQSEGDAGILEAAIGLEQTAVVAYETAAKSGKLKPPVEAAARLFQKQEQEHADALVAALHDLGGTPPAAPRASDVEGLSDVRNQNDILNFAIELEKMTVVAYVDAAGKLRSPELVKTGAQIVSNEAQHLVVLREALGKDPVPGAFEAGQSEEQPAAPSGP